MVYVFLCLTYFTKLLFQSSSFYMAHKLWFWVLSLKIIYINFLIHRVDFFSLAEKFGGFFSQVYEPCLSRTTSSQVYSVETLVQLGLAYWYPKTWSGEGLGLLYEQHKTSLYCFLFPSVLHLLQGHSSTLCSSQSFKEVEESVKLLLILRTGFVVNHTASKQSVAVEPKNQSISERLNVGHIDSCLLDVDNFDALMYCFCFLITESQLP